MRVVQIWRRVFGLGLLSTGVVCPCHVLTAAVGLVSGSTLLTPAAQDGLHALYTPAAVALGAALLRRGKRTPEPAA